MRPSEVPCTRPVTGEPSPDAGQGHLVLESFDGRTIATRLRANSPMKLLTPRRRSHTAWVISGSYGGGLVAGDSLHLNVDAGEHTKLFLGTQASTKVYRSTRERPCRQILTLDAKAGSICVVAPDPITPYANSVYQQQQTVNLEADASLIMVDWLTAGRIAYHERWAFSQYESRTDIFVDGRQVFRDALLLDSKEGPLDAVCRTGGLGCFATAVLMGPAVQAGALAAFTDVDRAPAHGRAGLIFAASPIQGGVILRVAGAGPEVVGRWLRSKLAFVAGLLGEDPWARTW